jgi:hypothetical protein
VPFFPSLPVKPQLLGGFYDIHGKKKEGDTLSVCPGHHTNTRQKKLTKKIPFDSPSANDAPTVPPAEIAAAGDTLGSPETTQL